MCASLFDKSSVEPNETQKLFHFFGRSRNWPVGDGFDFLLVSLNTIFGDHVTKICYLSLKELALRRFDFQVV
ncbi:hypothetical protein DPMN_070713 [Dreissena polymorpha]|uniref:Uncharacterized protein n=1 Tax=Dreissena polymorpha TaxID=45954 RepID=A0A9D4BP56_DREPO|nr:hypothetical protein DPMN_070713 [Dreissena polymorpha]